MARFFFGEEIDKHVFLVIGMGGCGKSQLAFKFFHDWVLNSKDNLKFDPSMVFFLDATTSQTLEDGYRAIAESRGVGDSAEGALAWLSTTDKPCFLLLDNADDPDLNYRKYFPRSTKRHILMTTRLQHAGQQYGSGERGSGERSFITLEDLHEDDAQELFAATAGLEDWEDLSSSIKTLLQELHYHALAVVQAGAGMRRLHLTVEKYTDLFRQHRTALMNGKIDRVTSIDLDDYKWTVNTVHHISLLYLQDNSTAKFLLKLFGHLHHTGITEELFRRAFVTAKTYEPTFPLADEEQSGHSALQDTLHVFSALDGSWASHRFRASMDELLSVSLASYDKLNKYYHLHPLTRDALRTDHPDPRPAAFLIHHASIKDEDDVIFEHEISPHAERVTSYCAQNDVRVTLHPDLAHRLGRICMYSNPDQLGRPEVLLRLSSNRYHSEVGETHLASIICLRSLLSFLVLAGRHQEAEDMGSLFLTKYASDLASSLDDPNTAAIRALAESAHIMTILRRHDDAERTRRQVFESKLSRLGPKDPCTLCAMSELARTLVSLGRLEEAEKMQKQVLESYKSSFEPGHHYIIHAMSNLARTLASLRHYEDAVELEIQVLESYRSSLGSGNSYTLLAMIDLAHTLIKLGRFEEAEKLQRQVLESRRSRLGTKHTYTVSAMINLAHTLSNLGAVHFVEAESLARQVLQSGVSSPRLEHLSTVTSMYTWVRTLANLGSLKLYQKAEHLARKFLKSSTSDLGPEHPNTIFAMLALASNLTNLGGYKAADQLVRQALRTSRSNLLPDHPKTIPMMVNLARTLTQFGRFKEAAKLDREVLQRDVSILGEEHPCTVIAKSNLAHTLINLDRCQAAEELQRQVIEINESKHGSEHTSTLYAKSALARTLTYLDRHQEAEVLQRQVTESNVSKLGPGHPYTLLASHALARILIKLRCHEEAEKLWIQILESDTSVLGTDLEQSHFTLAVKCDLAPTMAKLGRYEEAETMLRAVLRSIMSSPELAIGAAHPFTVNAMFDLVRTRLVKLGCHGDVGHHDVGRMREQLFASCSELPASDFSPDHPETYAAMRDGSIAIAIRKLGRANEAHELLHGAWSRLKTSLDLGPEHHMTRLLRIRLTRWEREDGYVRHATRLFGS